MPELGHLDQQGRELFNTVSQSPFAQIATNYGKDMLKNSKVRVLSETQETSVCNIVRQISSYFSIEPLKYYFNVSNSYVLNKLRVLLLPFMQKVRTPSHIQMPEPARRLTCLVSSHGSGKWCARTKWNSSVPHATTSMLPISVCTSTRGICNSP